MVFFFCQLLTKQLNMEKKISYSTSIIIIIIFFVIIIIIIIIPNKNSFLYKIYKNNHINSFNINR